MAFAEVRLVAGAVTLLALVALSARVRGGPVWPGARGRLVGSGALLAYLFGFSLAYGALDAGVGALILFGMVQMTMFGGALLARRGGARAALAGRGAGLWRAGAAAGAGRGGGLACCTRLSMAGPGSAGASIRWRGAGRRMRWGRPRGTLRWRCRWDSRRVGAAGRAAVARECRGSVLAVLSGAVTSGWAMRCGMRSCRAGRGAGGRGAADGAGSGGARAARCGWARGGAALRCWRRLLVLGGVPLALRHAAGLRRSFGQAPCDRGQAAYVQRAKLFSFVLLSPSASASILTTGPGHRMLRVAIRKQETSRWPMAP